MSKDVGPDLTHWKLFVPVKLKARTKCMALEHKPKEEAIVEIAIEYLRAHQNLITEAITAKTLSDWADPDHDEGS